MSAEDFHLLDDEQIDDSIIKQDSIKIYHQSGANVDNENSNVKLFFEENHNFIQVGNGYLEFDTKIRKADNTNFVNAEVIILVNNAFPNIYHDARISTSSGVKIEQNKFVRRISTLMRLVTQKDGDLSTYFDIIDESETAINNSSLKQILINSHTDENKGIIAGHLPLEYIFGFCKPIKR